MRANQIVRERPLLVTNLFQTIAELVPNLHGWCTPQKAQLLAASVLTLRPDTSVVIGVWGGRDTFALGLAHKEIGKGQVLAIDPWSASASIQGQNEANRAWWGNSPMHEQVYRDFLQKRGELGLNDWITVERMISDYATVPKRIDGTLVIDGNHGPQASKDVERFVPSVASGALVMLDDVNWEGGEVQKAKTRLLEFGFRSLYTIETSEMFQKI